MLCYGQIETLESTASALYGVGLWSNYAASTLLRFRYCYQCIKAFFGYSKYHSITSVLLDLKLPSSNTLIHNYRCSYNMKLSTSGNILISNIVRLASDICCVFSFCVFDVFVFTPFQCVWFFLVLAAFSISRLPSFWYY